MVNESQLLSKAFQQGLETGLKASRKHNPFYREVTREQWEKGRESGRAERQLRKLGTHNIDTYPNL